jgi:glycosyltransferase involved in cell wall biosynthesis
MAGAVLAGSVVIPAHNEAAVIAAGLTSLLSGLGGARLDVVVSCNGCTDGTAEAVRRSRLPVRVVEIPEASKPAALRAADRSCDVFPRLYLDADVRLSGRAALAVLDSLHTGPALAARPAAAYDTTSSTPAVQRYYRARAAAPRLHRSLWGAGAYALSKAGRKRFELWPDIVADDLFVDRLFTAAEVEVVECEPVVVRAPQTVSDLLIMLRRSYRGQAEADASGRPGSSASLETLREVLLHGLHGPAASREAATFIRLALAARRAVRRAGDVRWERDESSRAAA